jgi:hypothetical protein
VLRLAHSSTPAQHPPKNQFALVGQRSVGALAHAADAAAADAAHSYAVLVAAREAARNSSSRPFGFCETDATCTRFTPDAEAAGPCQPRRGQHADPCWLHFASCSLRGARRARCVVCLNFSPSLASQLWQRDQSTQCSPSRDSAAHASLLHRQGRGRRTETFEP